MQLNVQNSELTKERTDGLGPPGSKERTSGQSELNQILAGSQKDYNQGRVLSFTSKSQKSTAY